MRRNRTLDLWVQQPYDSFLANCATSPFVRDKVDSEKLHCWRARVVTLEAAFLLNMDFYLLYISSKILL